LSLKHLIAVGGELGRPDRWRVTSMIDAKHLGDVMDSLADRREAAASMIDVGLDAKREWFAEQSERRATRRKRTSSHDARHAIAT
jgi:hypothetical protein